MCFLANYLEFHYSATLILILAYNFLFDCCHQLQVKSNAPKPNQRKKWRRTTIQLVTNAPPPSQPETAEAPQRPHKGAPEADIPMKLPHKGAPEADIPMKLPRAMRSAASNGGNPFRERNSDKADQSGVNKEGGVPAPRSPLRQNKTSDEKENCGL